MKILLNFIFLVVVFPFYSIAQDCKSFMQMEVVAPSNSGPITASEGNVGLWVEWNGDNSSITMMDGTIWEYSYTDNKKNSHYKYKGSSLSTMPGTTYHEAIIIPDRTKMQIIYTFGFMGFDVKMYATYGYIGEGKDPAMDYVSEKETEFSYSLNGDRYRTFVKTKNKCSKCSGCSGYWGYKHGNGTYEGRCSNTDGHGHTCGHGPEKHGLRKW